MPNCPLGKYQLTLANNVGAFCFPLPHLWTSSLKDKKNDVIVVLILITSKSGHSNISENSLIYFPVN